MKLRLIFLLSISLLFSQNYCAQISDFNTTVVKIEEMTKGQNLALYQNSRSHDQLELINSCQDLGLIVFKHPSINQSDAQEIITSFLSETIEISKVSLLTDYSINQVNIDCRKEKARIILPNSKK